MNPTPEQQAEIDRVKRTLIPEAVDLRRAAELILACDPSLFDVTRAGEVIAEVKLTDRRITQLMTACATHFYLNPSPATTEGRAALLASRDHFRLMENEKENTDD